MVDPLLKFVPKLYREIADRLGVAAAVDVARKAGGQRVLIPNNPLPRHKLCQAIGVQAARILAEYNAGYVSLPRATALMAAIRHRDIRNDPRGANAVASAHGMTERQVRAIRNAKSRPATAPRRQSQTATVPKR